MMARWQFTYLAGLFRRTSDMAERWVPVLLLALVIDLEVRYFFVATRDPVFWRDEAHSVAVSQLPRKQFWSHLRSQWEPYAHFLLLRWWPQPGGKEEVSARCLSFVTILIATWLVYRGSYLWFGRRGPAVLVVVLVMCSPVVLERTIGVVKPYALALLAAAWVWERMEVLWTAPRRMRLWLWFAASALLAGNTQPVLFAWLAAVGLVWMRRCLLKREWRMRWRLGFGTAVPLTMLVAAAPSLVAAVAFAGADTGCARIPLSEWGIGLILRFWLRVIAGLSPLVYYGFYHALDDYISEGIRNFGNLPIDTILLLLAVTLCMAVGAGRILRRSARAYLPDALLLAAVPGILLTAGSLVNARLIWVWKCYSAVAIGAALLLSTLLSPSRWVMGLLIGATLLRTTVHYPAYATSADGRASDAKAAAEFVARGAREDDLIVLANTALSPAFSFYYHGPGEQVHHPYDHAIRYYRMAEMYRMQTNKIYAARTAQKIREAAAAGRRVWFLEGGTPEPLPDHPWYSTRDLPLFRAALQEGFVMVTNRKFQTTLEPFVVSLWLPRQETGR